ncbi:hypothetical protein [Ferruginibacter sp. SUN106]|uniref:hypothetical protein n=1 Tax=Ferruginibacter sp. SUN106 TaxID=2978348 RepID=UPI003D364804
MNLKATIASLLIFCIGNCFAQTTKVLQLKNKINFTERNTLLPDTGFILEQEVWYDLPNSIDEEYGLVLTINIKDTLRAKQLKPIDVNKDSNVIQCNWSQRSAWNWKKDGIKIKGTIRIISFTKTTVTAELKLTVTDYRFNHRIIYLYSGTRTFAKEKR